MNRSLISRGRPRNRGRRTLGAAAVVSLVAGMLAIASPVSAQDDNVTETQVLSNGQPAGVLYTPTEVPLGEDITIRGSGFFLTNGDGGSGGPVFINQPSGGTGAVTVPTDLRIVENQITVEPGASTVDPRSHGFWQSDADGDWSITIPFPTPENSSLTEATAWEAGQTQLIRVLTGTLVPGDQARTVGVEFTITDPAPEETSPSITEDPTDTTVDAGGTATFTAEADGDPAPSVQWQRLSGEDWVDIDNATDTTLSVPHVADNLDGSQYRAVFTNTAGTAASGSATLTVQTEPGTRSTQALANGQPAGVLYTPTEVPLGEDITIRGSGFFLTNDDGGSGGPVFINQPSGGTGPVDVPPDVRTVENQITVDPGASTVDPRSHGFWQSDADGDWSITIPFPTPENSSLTEATAWEAGQTQHIRVLTGTLVPGDQTRTVGADFTVTDSLPEPEEAPQITQHPGDLTVDEGDTATFTAAATGTPEPAVQWQRLVDGEWITVAGATDLTLTLDEVGVSLDGAQFRAVFTNTAGTATTDPATLTVNEDVDPEIAPTITTHPQSVTVDEGEAATFTAAATGTPNPSVQWQSRPDSSGTWTDLTGATTTELTVDDTTESQSGTQYRAVFTNPAGQAETSPATLTVESAVDPEVAPTITEHPGDLTVDEGEAAAFTAAATGTPNPSVQWQSRPDSSGTWTDVADGTDATLTLQTVGVELDGSQYRAVFTNTAGSATTDPATLTVNEDVDLEVAPTITTHPVSTTVDAGEDATFSAAAEGTPAPDVVWQRQEPGGGAWTTIGDATDTEFTVAQVTEDDDGAQYRAVFTNTAGTATTDPATLTVRSDDDDDSTDPDNPSADDLTEDNRGPIEAPSEAERGETVTLSGADDLVGDEVDVWLFSTPAHLGSTTVSDNGTLSATIPAAAELGDHRIAVYTADGDLIGWDDIAVVAASTDDGDSAGGGSGGEDSSAGGAGGSLPSTGAQASPWLLAMALIALLAGAGLLLTRRTMSSRE